MPEIAKRLEVLSSSITLKQNEKVQKLLETGVLVYNLTSGQLPYKPIAEFQNAISNQTKYLKSFQYSPISGLRELKRKFFRKWCNDRQLNEHDMSEKLYCLISNGSKQSLYNLFGSILNPDDEVILFTPYWISYPQMIELWGGKIVPLMSYSHDGYRPDLNELKKLITKKTKAILVNSPNNPAGIHYDYEWMKQLSQIVTEFPQLYLISDEVYADLSYFDPKPSYFYQFSPELLDRTIIVHGISKNLCSTGLRIGYTFAHPEIIKAMEKIQSHSTSGANTLIQRALLEFDFNLNDEFLAPILENLRTNTNTLRESFRLHNLGSCWYQTTSAFYFMLDFARTPYFEKFQSKSKNKINDYSSEITDEILDKTNIALVPGNEFGYPNSARMTLTLQPSPFREAVDLLAQFLKAD